MTEPRPLLAALWMMAGILAFTAMAVAGRAILVELDTFELMLYRSILGVAIMGAIVAARGGVSRIATARPGLHILRNLSHFTGQNLWFAGLTMVPLATVFALEFTSPIWVTILAVTFLGETLTRGRVTALTLGFLGVLLVARPGGDAPTLGLVLAAAAALGFAGSIVATKSLTRTDSVMTILFWLTASQTVMGLLAAGFDGDIAWPSGAVWPWIAVVGIAGLLAHTCLTNALGLAPATVVVPMDFLRLPVAALVGVALYAEALDPFVLGGAALIFLGNYLNLWMESRKAPQRI